MILLNFFLMWFVRYWDLVNFLIMMRILINFICCNWVVINFKFLFIIGLKIDCIFLYVIFNVLYLLFFVGMLFFKLYFFYVVINLIGRFRLLVFFVNDGLLNIDFVCF